MFPIVGHIFGGFPSPAIFEARVDPELSWASRMVRNFLRPTRWTPEPIVLNGGDIRGLFFDFFYGRKSMGNWSCSPRNQWNYGTLLITGDGVHFALSMPQLWKAEFFQGPFFQWEASGCSNRGPARISKMTWGGDFTYPKLSYFARNSRKSTLKGAALQFGQKFRPKKIGLDAKKNLVCLVCIHTDCISCSLYM